MAPCDRGSAPLRRGRFGSLETIDRALAPVLARATKAPLLHALDRSGSLNSTDGSQGTDLADSGTGLVSLNT